MVALMLPEGSSPTMSMPRYTKCFGGTISASFSSIWRASDTMTTNPIIFI
jgi:hypothetical protein